jgi:hypothetical protein
MFAVLRAHARMSDDSESPVVPQRPIIEDQITQLCSDALHAEGKELERILSNLRMLLQEHMARIRDRALEITPILRRKKTPLTQ